MSKKQTPFFFLIKPTTQTPAYHQDWRGPLKLQLQLVRQFEISTWLVYPTQAGAGAEGDPQLHTTIQGARLMEAARCDTQFWVLHGRAGGVTAAAPGWARSPLLTAHQPEPTTRSLLTEAHAVGQSPSSAVCATTEAALECWGPEEAILCVSRREKGRKGDRKPLREHYGRN